jgi:hypothetical protein
VNLRIAWASPWSQRSAVAAFGARVLEELQARGHTVEVLRTETGRAARWPARHIEAQVRAWNQISPTDLARSTDAIVLNISNDFQACGAMLHNFHLLGAIGIFHDLTLGRLVAGWARTFPKGRDVLRKMGDASEWFGAGLAGALVTKQRGLERLAASCAGDVRVVSQGSDHQHAPQQLARAWVDALLALLPAAIERRPLILTGQALGRIFASLGLQPDDPGVQAVARRLDLLFRST